MIRYNNMKYVFPSLALLLLLFPIAALALNLNLDYPKFLGGPDINQDQSLPAVIAWVYYTIVGISGLAAFAMIVYGGIQWLMSAANPSLASDAKDRIQNALLGLLLVLSSFILLEIINPGFTELNFPTL